MNWLKEVNMDDEEYKEFDKMVAELDEKYADDKSIEKAVYNPKEKTK
jgi:hypothetical protein